MTRIANTFCAMAALTIGAVGANCHALTIEINYVPTGEVINGVGVATPLTGKTTGGGNLQSIVRAAADVWESLILDEHMLVLNVGWFAMDSQYAFAFHQGLSAQGDPQREELGSLAFNSRYNGTYPLYLDPTPESNEEFELTGHEFADFGSGPVETMREYTFKYRDTTPIRDLFSTAVHEIGHALGLAGWPFFEEEVTRDSDIDIKLNGFVGAEIPVTGDHLNVPGPVLSIRGRPASSRRDVTQTDLLTVCQLSQFQQCNLSVRPTDQSDQLPSDFELADLDTDGDVDGQDFLLWQRIQSADAATATGLETWVSQYGNSLASSPDFDSDGDVDGHDFLTWQRLSSAGQTTSADLAAWQTTYGFDRQSAAAIALPEPRGWLLMFAAAVIATCWRCCST